MPPNRDLDIEGRRAEFEVTALPHMGVLHTTARRLTHGSDDAGDLVQETYLRAYRTFDNFRRGTNCRSWLLTILYSVYINEYHKARRRPTVSIDELEGRFERYLESSDDAGQAATTVGVGRLRLDLDVAHALQQLPQEFAAVVLFVDLEGLSYDEAAVVLECPVGTIRSRLYRARRLLFALLQDYAASRGFKAGGP